MASRSSSSRVIRTTRRGATPRIAWAAVSPALAPATPGAACELIAPSSRRPASDPWSLDIGADLRPAHLRRVGHGAIAIAGKDLPGIEQAVGIERAPHPVHH